MCFCTIRLRSAALVGGHVASLIVYCVVVSSSCVAAAIRAVRRRRPRLRRFVAAAAAGMWLLERHRWDVCENAMAECKKCRDASP